MRKGLHVVFFIVLTLAGSFGRCVNIRPDGLMFKQLHLNPANVNAYKSMYDPYITKWFMDFNT